MLVATLVASLLDPGNNGFDISDALEVCLTIGAIYGALVIIAKAVRWIDARRDRAHRLDIEGIMAPHLDAIREQIVALTLPIQPESNGGLSMTDLHSKVDEAIAAVRENGAATKALAVRINAIESARQTKEHES